MRSGKYLIICLVVVLIFAFTGCARNNVTDNNSSTLSDKTGVELPEQEFGLNEESQGSENTNINDEDKQNSSSENTNTTSSKPGDETPSEVVDEEEDTSSDDISKPTKGDDGSIELPFDKW